MFPIFDLDLAFGPQKYSFHRPFYEDTGTYTINKDGKLIVMINVLGVDEKDLDVSVKAVDEGYQNLIVSGKTHNEVFDKDFSIRWVRSTKKPIKEIAKTVQNGLLVMEIEFETPVQPEVKIYSK